MPPIEWRDEFRVHIPEIDQQHKKLAGLINDFETAFQQGRGSEVLDEIIGELIEYSKIHFLTEEKYMAGFAHDLAASHKEGHIRFNEEVCRFIREMKTPSDALPGKIIKFLKDWWHIHITSEDRVFKQKKSRIS